MCVYICFCLASHLLLKTWRLLYFRNTGSNVVQATIQQSSRHKYIFIPVNCRILHSIQCPKLTCLHTRIFNFTLLTTKEHFLNM